MEKPKDQDEPILMYKCLACEATEEGDRPDCPLDGWQCDIVEYEPSPEWPAGGISDGEIRHQMSEAKRLK